MKSALLFSSFLRLELAKLWGRLNGIGGADAPQSFGQGVFQLKTLRIERLSPFRQSATLMAGLLAGLVLVSVSASPRLDDCRNGSTQNCCDNLTQFGMCIEDPFGGGCWPWEPPCCDNIIRSGSLDVTIAVSPGVFEASSFNLTHLTAGCAYYKALCGDNDPSCEHENFLRWLNCHDQYQSGFDHCPGQ